MTPEDKQRLARFGQVLHKYEQWTGIGLQELVDEDYLWGDDLDWLAENTDHSGGEDEV